MPEISSDDRSGDAGASIAPLHLPDDRQLVMRTMPMPADANGNGRHRHRANHELAVVGQVQPSDGRHRIAGSAVT